MKNVTLAEIFLHPITQKYLQRSGIAHAVKVTEHAFHLAFKYNVDLDLATKAALLHDIGHYEWYRNGKWDYELYRENDIHAIKGAERAHKLLIRLGEEPQRAKQISVAILLHTDSYLPEAQIKRSPLQKVVKLADEMDEEKGGNHHYKVMDKETALQRLQRLDTLIETYHPLPAYKENLR
ncbi:MULTISPECIES: HD domain-containing protein [Sutcliffiella]|uniref:HD domain-containing protein n=1 Tax=Sutcliffiella TaxID=2837511 RepID=UPI0022DD563C|nr:MULTISPECIES: HD domain-containing protein [Sutcliffiella]MED4016971.1 HD domain-containing protein [Sutcliffiella cohnii]WBL16336.1 HD domain-containing protein [Sutcliffiella sp. NC1]